MDSNLILKTLLTLVLLCPGICSGATWSLIGNGGGASISADLSSIKRTGDLVELLTLWDFEEPQTGNGPAYLSRTQKSIYNCTKQTSAITGDVVYSKSGGQGKVLFQRSKPAVFEPAKPGSTAAGILQFACAYKITHEIESDSEFLQSFRTDYTKGCASESSQYGKSDEEATKLCSCVGDEMTRSFSVEQLRNFVKLLTLTEPQKMRISEISQVCAKSLETKQ